MTALSPGDATIEGKIPGLAAKSGFLFIKALGQVGFYVDGAINWDIATLVKSKFESNQSFPIPKPLYLRQPDVTKQKV